MQKRKRILFGSGVVLLAILVTLVVWQGSFTLGSFAPSSLQQTFLFWVLSTVIFILTVTLGFILFRTAVKLYLERQSNRPGSHIKSKLIVGAIASERRAGVFPGAVERLGAESESGKLVQAPGAERQCRPDPGGQRSQPGGARQTHRASAVAGIAIHGRERRLL